MKALPIAIAAGVLVTAMAVSDRPPVESTPQQVRVPTVPAVEQTIGMPALAARVARAHSIAMPTLTASDQQVRSLDVQARAQELRSPESASVRSAQVRTKLPDAIDTGAIEDADYMRMILTLVDDARLRVVLKEWNVPIREDTTPVRDLPAFFTAVGCVVWSPKPSRAEAMDGFDCDVKMAMFIGDDRASVRYVREHPEQKFLVVIDARRLSAEALKALAGDNIVAVVVGHYEGADATVAQFAEAAERALVVRHLTRLVSDVPVLLAVSPTNFTTHRRVAGWTDAFGDQIDGFDGWAIYNLHLFPAILESNPRNPRNSRNSRNPRNPRQWACERLNLSADKPCVLLDFMGTPAVKPEMAGYVRKVWEHKWPLLRKALADQGWRGIAIYSTTIADARMKAKAVSRAGP